MSRVPPSLAHGPLPSLLCHHRAPCPAGCASRLTDGLRGPRRHARRYRPRPCWFSSCERAGKAKRGSSDRCEQGSTFQRKPACREDLQACRPVCSENGFTSGIYRSYMLSKSCFIGIYKTLHPGQ